MTAPANRAHTLAGMLATVPPIRALAVVARELANLNAQLADHPGRHAYACDQAQDAWCALADRRLDIEAEFRAAIERDTGVNTALLSGAL